MTEIEYMKERVNDQIKWYSNKATHCKQYHENLSLLSIILSSITGVLALLGFAFPMLSPWPSILSSISGVLVTVLLATDKLKKYQELHTQYRNTCEELKREKFLYLTSSGEYSNGDFQLFVQRCESVMTTEVGNWAILNEKKD